MRSFASQFFSHKFFLAFLFLSRSLALSLFYTCSIICRDKSYLSFVILHYERFFSISLIFFEFLDCQEQLGCAKMRHSPRSIVSTANCITNPLSDRNRKRNWWKWKKSSKKRWEFGRTIQGKGENFKTCAIFNKSHQIGMGNIALFLCSITRKWY